MKNSSHITILDEPCGTGKTTRMIQSFEPHRRYLVITPLLSEADRIVRDAEVEFFQPQVEDTQYGTKLSSLLTLIEDGKNVVTTHKLYTALAHVAEAGYLSGYDIIIDEVPDVVKDLGTISPTSFLAVYKADGYVTIEEDGRVRPTQKWLDNAAFTNEAFTKGRVLLDEAKAGCLYVLEDKMLFWALPPSLLSAGRSVTILTYLAEGSMLLPYLRKRGLGFDHEVDKARDLAFRMKAKELISVRTISALERFNWSHTGQNRMTGKVERERAVRTALSSLRRRALAGVDPRDIIITSAKKCWFYKGQGPRETSKPKPTGYALKSSMFGATWLSNTTRGTNDHVHCSKAVYLWDQHPNPAVMTWLNLRPDQVTGTEYANRYATTELIQWLYRTRVRRGEPVEVFIPSERMRKLLTSYLNAEDLLPQAA